MEQLTSALLADRSDEPLNVAIKSWMQPFSVPAVRTMLNNLYAESESGLFRLPPVIDQPVDGLPAGLRTIAAE